MLYNIMSSFEVGIGAELEKHLFNFITSNNKNTGLPSILISDSSQRLPLFLQIFMPLLQ